MALNSTMHVFTVDLADADRGVYETLEIRAALHPSESTDYMLARVLAYCFEYTEGIAFARGGVSDQEEPTLYARDLTGALTLWVEIGNPAAERIHLAAKSAPRVAVYCHRDPHLLLAKMQANTIHRADEIALYALPRELLEGLLKHLERRVKLSLTISDGHIYCSVGEDTFEARLEQMTL